MTFKKILPALALLTLPVIVQAEDYPAPVEAMRDRGIEVLERFDAPSGLTGYTALYNGRPLALYVTEDGKHALIGSLLNAEGDDLTGAILEEKVSRPQSKVMWEKLKGSTWIADGSDKAETIVYAFTDPNCPYCKRFWNDARPWVDAGKVQIRHVMVGTLGESSQKKAAFLLTAKDQKAALKGNESGKAPAQEAKSIEAKQRAQLDDNQQLMASLGASGTPAILYLDETGMMQMHPGAPQGEQLIELLGPRP
ncbi:MAG TPA: thiol:disulfide interchange protein DsbG [Gammaproteobacteria bacterium]|nr:thiol:disulfide interchange protein DsbG [Gammaproteobacteria bacterium]